MLLTISVFKSLNNLYPQSSKNVFQPTSTVHSYNVQGASNNVFVPKPRTEAAQQAVSYGGQSCGMAQKLSLKTRSGLSKISSCRVITTSRRGIKRLGISFGSIFLLFSNKSSWGPLSQQPGKIPGLCLLMTTLQDKPQLFQVRPVYALNQGLP